MIVKPRSWEGPRKEEAHQLQVYADDVNVSGGSLYSIKKNTEALIIASKETGLEVNAHKTRYMVMSWGQNAGRSHSIKIDISSFERLGQLKYLGTFLTSQNSIQEEIKRRLKSGKDCYNSLQNILSFSLLFKYIKIKIYRKIIVPVVLYGCETWPLTLREERRLRVLENRM